MNDNNNKRRIVSAKAHDTWELVDGFYVGHRVIEFVDALSNDYAALFSLLPRPHDLAELHLRTELLKSICKPDSKNMQKMVKLFFDVIPVSDEGDEISIPENFIIRLDDFPLDSHLVFPITQALVNVENGKIHLRGKIYRKLSRLEKMALEKAIKCAASNND